MSYKFGDSAFTISSLRHLIEIEKFTQIADSTLAGEMHRLKAEIALNPAVPARYQFGHFHVEMPFRIKTLRLPGYETIVDFKMTLPEKQCLYELFCMPILCEDEEWVYFREIHQIELDAKFVKLFGRTYTTEKRAAFLLPLLQRLHDSGIIVWKRNYSNRRKLVYDDIKFKPFTFRFVDKSTHIEGPPNFVEA